MSTSTVTEPNDVAARSRAMLHELAELTLELAREVQQQAIRQARAPGPDAATAAGLLFTRVARTLRQIIALDARIASDQRASAAGTVAERARRNAADRQRKGQARQQLRRHLQDAINADTTPRDVDALLRDLDDRLHDDDIDAALSVDALTDIVIALCAEFGLRPDLSKFTDEELAHLGATFPLQPPPTPRVPNPPASFLHPD